MRPGREFARSGYCFDLVAARNTAQERQLVSFHTKGWMYKLKLIEHFMVANIGLEFVVIASTIPKIAGIVFE